MRNLFHTPRLSYDELKRRDECEALDSADNDNLKREAEFRREENNRTLREYDLQLSSFLGREVDHDKRSSH